MRIVLVGPPRAGKSTYARQLRVEGVPTFCSDPLSLVKEPEQGVTYLPEGLDWSEASRFVCDEWLPMRGPFCVDGVATVRALRKAMQEPNLERLLRGMRVIRFREQFEHAVTKPGQRSMAKAIDSVWSEIGHLLPCVVEYR